MEEREKKNQNSSGVALDVWEQQKGKSKVLKLGHLLN